MIDLKIECCCDGVLIGKVKSFTDFYTSTCPSRLEGIS